MKDKINDAFKAVTTLIKTHPYYLLLLLPCILLDLSTRFSGFKVTFGPIYDITPLLFTILYEFLFIGIAVNLRPLAGKILIWIMFIISFFLFMLNVIYYSLTNFYFSFNLLLLADEGSSYIWDTIVNTNPIIYAVAAVLLGLSIFIIITCIPHIEFKKKTNFKGILFVIVVFVIMHLVIPLTYGPANKELTWSSFKNKRNVYNEFSDVNKCMRITGIFEYTTRNFYTTFIKSKEKISKDDKAFLDNEYSQKLTDKNKYTGMFKDKNLIILQLEGMDSWMLTKDNTPNLYSLKSESIDMSTNHFSLYTGGGSTFNSEFAVNTGYTTPTTFIENVYNLHSNTYDTTLPKLFKNHGYDVNAYHMNNGDFYSRSANYHSWGYDNYYSLKEIAKYSDKFEYELDRNLILNKDFNEKIFNHKSRFVDYIISYTPHTPFSTHDRVGKLLAKLNFGDKVPDMDEEDVAKMMASETDKMVGLLVDELKKRDLYDDTVILAFADHYLYTINNKAVLEKYKISRDNRINNTPLFIWSSDIDHKIIKKVNMQMDILPTVLNLFGIEYNPAHLIGSDILDGKDGLAYFSDYSWYDGKTYVSNGKVTDGKDVSKSYLTKTSQKVKNLINKNDLTLKYNYWFNENK